MESLAFLGLIFLLAFLIYKSVKLKKQFIKKSKLVQEEIEELKIKNILIEEKNDVNRIASNDVNEITKQVANLHKLVIKKHLK